MTPAPSPAPPITLLTGVNNVYGKAQYKKDAGVVKYLGQFNETHGGNGAGAQYRWQMGGDALLLEARLPFFYLALLFVRALFSFQRIR